MKDLKVRPKTQTPKRNRGKLHAIGFGNDFLDMTQKHKQQKKKNKQMGLHQIFLSLYKGYRVKRRITE